MLILFCDFDKITELKSNNDEKSCKYISSRGILKSCDFYDINPISSNLSFIIENYNLNNLFDGCTI